MFCELLQVALIGLRAGRGRLRDQALFIGRELGSDLGDDLLCHRALQRQRVHELAVVGFRPEVLVGAPVDGYEAADCYLLEPVAEALQRVELALREQKMRLRIFDCYRPVRAVSHFVRWADDVDDQRTKPAFYPSLDKTQLLGVYIGRRSGHSRGATIDLTLMRCDAGGQCTSLDMGTDFDFFDPLANTDSPQATPQQRENRQLLRIAMEKEGFQNYPMELWHYTFRPEPSLDMAYDFPVK